MFRVILKSLLVLSFSAPALAIPLRPKNKMRPASATSPQHLQPRYTVASNEQRPLTPTQQQQYRIPPVVDRWVNYLMLGMNAGFEYSRLGADLRVKAKQQSTGLDASFTGNSDPASSLGVSLMYARLGRDALGFSAGGTITHKIDNNSGTKGSMSYGEALTLFRPEANLLLGHNSGLWGGIGAHMQYISGESDISDSLEQFGGGIQALVGFVVNRNIGLDLGYYVSVHKVGGDAVSAMRSQGFEINDSDSYYSFNQWRLKVSFMF